MRDEFSFNNIEDIKVQDRSKGGNGQAILTVVNAKSSKRVTIAQSIVEDLIENNKIQITIDSNKIIIGNNLSITTNLTVKKLGNKFAIYNNKLVEKIIAKLNLKFDNKSSISFYNYEIKEEGNKKAVLIYPEI